MSLHHTTDTIKRSMELATRTFPSGYWQTTYNDRPAMADTKAGLRQLLSDYRNGRR